MLTNAGFDTFWFSSIDPPPFPYCLIRLCSSTIMLVKIETNWFNLMVVSFKEDNSNTHSKQLKVQNRLITVMHILQKVPRLLARTSRLSPCVTRSFYIYSPEPLHALLGKQPTWKTADQAVEAIQSGKQKYVHWLLSRNSVNSVFLFFVALEIGCRSSAMGFLSWMALHVYSYDVCAIIFMLYILCVYCA